MQTFIPAGQRLSTTSSYQERLDLLKPTLRGWAYRLGLNLVSRAILWGAMTAPMWMGDRGQGFYGTFSSIWVIISTLTMVLVLAAPLKKEEETFETKQVVGAYIGKLSALDQVLSFALAFVMLYQGEWGMAIFVMITASLFYAKMGRIAAHCRKEILSGDSRPF